MLDGAAEAYARCAAIARAVMEQAIKERDGETSPHESDHFAAACCYFAAACWADCASQILWEIEQAANA